MCSPTKSQESHGLLLTISILALCLCFGTSSAAISISSLSPSAGDLVGNTSITITGSGFSSSAFMYEVVFEMSVGGQTQMLKVHATYQSSTTLQAYTPDASGIFISANANVHIEMTSSGTEVSSNTVTFRFYETPIIWSVDPTSASFSGGDTVTLVGSNFLNLPTLSVVFDTYGSALNIPVPVTYISSTQLRVTAPAASVFGSNATSNDWFDVFADVSLNGVDFTDDGPAFEYFNPNLDYYQAIPKSGPSIGGTLLTIKGGPFPRSNSVTVTWQFRSIFFFTTERTATGTWLSPSEVVCRTPNIEDLLGNFLWSGTNDRWYQGATYLRFDGNFFPTKSNLYPTFTWYDEAFTWPSISPSSGPLRGGTSVTLTAGQTVVKSDYDHFEEALFFPISAKMEAAGKWVTQTGRLSWLKGDRNCFWFICFDSPFQRPTVIFATPQTAQETFTPGTTTKVTVSMNQQQYRDSGNVLFTFFADDETVEGIVPAVGPSTGGTVVTITGQDYVNVGSSLKLQFLVSGTQYIVTGTYLNHTAVRCTTPVVSSSLSSSTASVQAQVRLSLDARTYTSTFVGFTFYNQGLFGVQSISPRDGPISGGQTVTITGDGFVNTAQAVVRFSSASNNMALEGTGYKYVSSQVATIKTPVGYYFPDNGTYHNAMVSVSMNGADYSSSSVVYAYHEGTTPAPTPTVSPSRSKTPSVSISFSPSSSRTPTHTATLTPPEEPTASPSSSRSITPSKSGTASNTRSTTPSASLSHSHSKSGTGTFTPSWSGTPSHTKSGAGTPSGTPSSAETQSKTATSSHTRTHTGTVTTTASVTTTRSTSGTRTMTASGTGTRTASISESATASHTRAASASNTPSVSMTVTPSHTAAPTSATASISGTASPSRSTSHSETPTHTLSRSLSASNTPPITGTASVTNSHTPSTSRQATPSGTATPSVSPKKIVLQAVSPAGAPLDGAATTPLVIEISGFDLAEIAVAEIRCIFATVDGSQQLFTDGSYSSTPSPQVTCNTPVGVQTLFGDGESAHLSVEVDSLSPPFAVVRSDAPLTFAFYDAPIVSTLSPDSTPIAVGVNVTVTGEGFPTSAPLSAGWMVRLTAQEGTLTHQLQSTAIFPISSTEMRVLFPPLPFPPSPLSPAAVVVHLGVSRNDGADWTSLSPPFSYINASFAGITVHPPSGSVAGGTQLMIHSPLEQHFVNQSGVECNFHSQRLGLVFHVRSNASFVNSTTMLCSTPSIEGFAPDGVTLIPVSISVSLSDGTPFSSNGSFVFYNWPYRVLSLSPSSGSVAGGTEVRAELGPAVSTEDVETLKNEEMFPIAVRMRRPPMGNTSEAVLHLPLAELFLSPGGRVCWWFQCTEIPEETAFTFRIPNSPRDAPTLPFSPGDVVDVEMAINGVDFHANLPEVEKGRYTFYEDAFNVTRVVPDHGPLGGGNTITIIGNGFTSSPSAFSILFSDLASGLNLQTSNAESESPVIRVLNQTALTVVVPTWVGEPEVHERTENLTIHISVSQSQGDSYSSPGVEYTMVPDQNLFDLQCSTGCPVRGVWTTTWGMLEMTNETVGIITEPSDNGPQIVLVDLAYIDNVTLVGEWVRANLSHNGRFRIQFSEDCLHMNGTYGFRQSDNNLDLISGTVDWLLAFDSSGATATSLFGAQNGSLPSSASSQLFVDQRICPRVRSLPILQVRARRANGTLVDALSLAEGLTTLDAVFSQDWKTCDFESDKYKMFSVNGSSMRETLFVFNDHDVSSYDCGDYLPTPQMCEGWQQHWSGTPQGLIAFGATNTPSFCDLGSCCMTGGAGIHKPIQSIVESLWVKPDINPSASPSVSMSATPSSSRTATRTPSVTRTETPSNSETPSKSLSASGTPSSTGSVTATRSISLSASISATGTMSKSAGASPSATPSTTRSISLSPSTSRTRSTTASGTPTRSASRSVTSSHSPSGSLTSSHSATASRTASVSRTASISRTVTPSTSVGATPSSTPISSTPSVSATPSLTIGVSASQSASLSLSLSPTTSHSEGVSASETPVASSTMSISLSTTLSPSKSASHTGGVSNSASPTFSRSHTTSRTQTPTFSPSSSPLPVKVTRVQPPQGVETGGTVLSIYGSGFRLYPQMSVEFALSELSTEIRVTAPLVYINSTLVQTITPNVSLPDSVSSSPASLTLIFGGNRFDSLNATYTYTAGACFSPLWEFPACNVCVASAALKFPDCTMCSNPLRKYVSGESDVCSTCMEDMWDPANGCSQCVDSGKLWPNCTTCKNPGQALPSCTTCLNANLTAPNCTTCKDSQYTGLHCTECVVNGADPQRNCSVCLDGYVEGRDGDTLTCTATCLPSALCASKNRSSTLCLSPSLCGPCLEGFSPPEGDKANGTCVACDVQKCGGMYREGCQEAAVCGACLPGYTPDTTTSGTNNTQPCVCQNPLHDASQNCSVCENPLYAFPGCGECKVTGMKFPACTECTVQGQEASTNCTTCHNLRYKYPSCNISSGCSNPLFSASSNCTQCTNPLLDVAFQCQSCSNTLQSALLNCTVCSVPSKKYPQCTECINPFRAGSSCEVCSDPLYDVGQNCFGCVNPDQDFAGLCRNCSGENREYPSCDTCVNDRLSFPDCTSCSNDFLEAPDCLRCSRGAAFSVPDCDSCVDPHKTVQSDCTVCEGGYKPPSDSSSSDALCVPICLNDTACGALHRTTACTSPFTCGDCAAGFVPNATDPSSGSCIACDVNQCASEHRDQCTAPNTCGACLNGFVEKNGQCQCSNSLLDPSESCQVCIERTHAPPDCTQCLNQRHAFPSCDSCQVAGQQFPNCISCTNPNFAMPDCTSCHNPLLMGDQCNQCKNPLFDFTQGCLACVNTAQKYSDQCLSCTNSKMVYPSCDVCQNSLMDPSTGCTLCTNRLLDASTDCQLCQNRALSGPDCTQCIVPNQQAPSCTTCINSQLVYPNCDTCSDTKFAAPDCTSCADPHKTQGSGCSECENGYKSSGSGGMCTIVCKAADVCASQNRSAACSTPFECGNCLSGLVSIPPSDNCVDCVDLTTSLPGNNVVVRPYVDIDGIEAILTVLQACPAHMSVSDFTFEWRQNNGQVMSRTSSMSLSGTMLTPSAQFTFTVTATYKHANLSLSVSASLTVSVSALTQLQLRILGGQNRIQSVSQNLLLESQLANGPVDSWRVSYQWDCVNMTSGSGGSGSCPLVPLTPNPATWTSASLSLPSTALRIGTYNLSVTATYDSIHSTAWVKVEVVSALVPTVSISSSSSVFADQTVVLVGNAVEVPGVVNNSIASVQWTEIGGQLSSSALENAATSPTNLMTLTIPAANLRSDRTYTFRLTVIDMAGRTGWATQSVTIVPVTTNTFSVSLTVPSTAEALKPVTLGCTAHASSSDSTLYLYRFDYSVPGTGWNLLRPFAVATSATVFLPVGSVQVRCQATPLNGSDVVVQEAVKHVTVSPASSSSSGKNGTDTAQGQIDEGDVTGALEIIVGLPITNETISDIEDILEQIGNQQPDSVDAAKSDLSALLRMALNCNSDLNVHLRSSMAIMQTALTRVQFLRNQATTSQIPSLSLTLFVDSANLTLQISDAVWFCLRSHEQSTPNMTSTMIPEKIQFALRVESMIVAGTELLLNHLYCGQRLSTLSMRLFDVTATRLSTTENAALDAMFRVPTGVSWWAQKSNPQCTTSQRYLMMSLVHMHENLHQWSNPTSASTLRGPIQSIVLYDNDVQGGALAPFSPSVITTGQVEDFYQIVIPHPTVQFEVNPNLTCVYWDVNAATWSNTGCFMNMNASNSQLTICQCNHLTTFGVSCPSGDCSKVVNTNPSSGGGSGAIIGVIIGVVLLAVIIGAVYYRRKKGPSSQANRGRSSSQTRLRYEEPGSHTPDMLGSDAGTPGAKDFWSSNILYGQVAEDEVPDANPLTDLSHRGSVLLYEGDVNARPRSSPQPYTVNPLDRINHTVLEEIEDDYDRL